MNSHSLIGLGGLANHTEETGYWSGVIAMLLCVFALAASKFIPVSLLTLIADDLHVTQGMAGQGIAISGAFAGLTSLSIAGWQNIASGDDTFGGGFRWGCSPRPRLLDLHDRPHVSWCGD